jgi:cytochrome b561
MRSPASERHPLLVRFLHWSTALTIIVSVSAILCRETVEQKAIRIALLGLHRQLGLLVMLALLARIVFRLAVGLRNYAADVSGGMRAAAHVAHWLMYTVLAGVTLLGWALCSAHAVHLRLLGLLALPDLVSADSDLADTLSDYHIWGACILAGLVVTHVIAALWHHFIRRDAVLSAMLPRGR